MSITMHSPPGKRLTSQKNNNDKRQQSQSEKKHRLQSWTKVMVHFRFTMIRSVLTTYYACVYLLVAQFDLEIMLVRKQVLGICQLFILNPLHHFSKKLNSRRYIFTHECRQFPPNLYRRRTSSFLSVGPFLVQISMQMNASKQVLFFQVNKWDWLLAYLFDEN